MKTLVHKGIVASVESLVAWHNNISDAQYYVLGVAADIIANALKSDGKVLFTGIGKNVHCCEKLAATCHSISLDAAFFDAVHAMHGDFGMIRNNDVIVAFSKTGNTSELATAMTYLREHRELLAPYCQIIGINFAGGKVTDMNAWADLLVSLPAIDEDSRNPRIPTNSLLASQLVGDNIMLSVAEQLGTDFDRFYTCHPGGGLQRARQAEQAQSEVAMQTVIRLDSQGNAIHTQHNDCK